MSVFPLAYMQSAALTAVLTMAHLSHDLVSAPDGVADRQRELSPGPIHLEVFDIPRRVFHGPSCRLFCVLDVLYRVAVAWYEVSTGLQSSTTSQRVHHAVKARATDSFPAFCML